MTTNRFHRRVERRNAGHTRLGQVFIFDRGESRLPRYIVHFPTNWHWRDSSHIEDIGTGLTSLVSELRRLQIDSIAIPALGCGLGGLEWLDVKAMISLAFFGNTDNVSVRVYEPL